MDIHFDANRLVDAWTDVLGPDLPKTVTESAAVLAAVGYAEAPLVPFDAASVTTANAEKLVTEYATQLATTSEFATAKSQALNAAGTRVLVAAREALPDVLVLLQPRLTVASEALAAALDVLPENPTPEVLISSPAQVEAWNAAHTAIAELDTLDRFISGLTPIYGHRGEPALRLLSTTTRSGLQRLLRTQGQSGALKPLWVLGATGGDDISWSLNTPDVSSEMKRVLDSLPPTEYKKPVFMSLR